MSRLTNVLGVSGATTTVCALVFGAVTFQSAQSAGATSQTGSVTDRVSGQEAAASTDVMTLRPWETAIRFKLGTQSRGDTSVLLVADRSRERAAATLYADARTYLNLRAYTAAKRLLESVIEGYPETASAQRAKTDLASLNQRVFRSYRPFTLGGPIDGDLNKRDAPPVKRREPIINDNFAPLRWLDDIDILQRDLRTTAGDRIFFAAFSSAVGQRGRAALHKQIAWLRARPDIHIAIEAHGDEPGALSHVNRDWAARRAQVIRARLIAGGITAERIKTLIRGDTKRIVLCDSAPCQAQNRRVVLKLVRPDNTPTREARKKRR